MYGLLARLASERNNFPVSITQPYCDYSHRGNSQRTSTQFGQNVSVTKLTEFLNFIWIQTISPKTGNQKESRHFAKILIHQEWSQKNWTCAFTDKNDKFRQNGQVFGWIFSNYVGAEFSRSFIGVKFSEFSRSHFVHLAKFFVNLATCLQLINSCYDGCTWV